MPRAAKYDYRELKAQYLSAEPPISLRELARRNELPEGAHKAITARARAEGWTELRDLRLARTDDRTVEAIAARETQRRLRRLEVEDNAIEAIDEAISKMRSDMKLTKLSVWRDPETKEYHREVVPATTYRPAEVVQLIDRIKALFDGTVVPAPAETATAPALTQINFGSFDGSNPEHRALAAAVVGATRSARGSAGARAGDSPLPYAPGAGEDE